MEPVTLGKYQLVRKIASGGMAEIFLARASSVPGYEKQVVVKKILPQLAANNEFLQMFLDEARVAATLQHPNIVQMYDIGAADGNYWITMEYLQGEDMRHILKALAKARKPLPLEHALNVLTGACAGLHYAHEKAGYDGQPLGIVHRDVNPQNIFVTWEGTVKVVDFGIAKAANRFNQTFGGQLKGKIQYMSPEQCRSETVDRRSDVYSLGILLYELTTGLRLYKGDSEFQVMKKIITEPPPMPSMILRTYPKELEKIVLKALQKRPEDRHQTAQEVQADLEQFARQHKLVISAISLGQFLKQIFGERAQEWRDSQAVSGMVTAATPPRTAAARGSNGAAAAAAEDDEDTDVERVREYPRRDTDPPMGDTVTEPSIVVTPSMMVPMPTEDEPMAKLAALASSHPLRAADPPLPPLRPPRTTLIGVAAPVPGAPPTPAPPAWPSQVFATEIVAPLPPPIADSSLADELEPGANAHRGPRRWALALGGAAAATVLGVVVVWALSPQDQVGGEPSAPAETPDEVASAEPAPAAVAAIPPDPAAAPGGAAGAPGFAKVTSLPFGATVFVDGLPYGDTTPTVLESLPPGPHEVKVSYEGYRDAVTTLEIKPNALVSYQASLERIDGKSVVDEVEPPAEPKKRLSKAEARKARKAELLAARKAEAEAKAEAKAQAREDAKAKAEAEAKAQSEPEAEAEPASTASRRAERLARSEPARKKTKRGSRDVAAARPNGEGELRVASTPSCEVLVDGQSKGFTPLRVEGIPAGRHTLRLVSGKFNISKTVSVKIAAGDVTKKSFSFAMNDKPSGTTD